MASFVLICGFIILFLTLVSKLIGFKETQWDHKINRSQDPNDDPMFSMFK